MARLDSAVIDAPPGWDVQPGGPAAAPTAGGVFSAEARGVDARRFAVTVAAGAPLSQPYFLARPLAGALYDWSGVPDALRGEPFEAPPVFARLATTIGGVAVSLRREVVYRYNDEVRGETRRPLFVVPAVGVEVSPTEMVWPVAAEGTRNVTVTLTSGMRGRVAGEVRLEVPDGWPPVPSQAFALEGKDTQRSYTFSLSVPRTVPAGRFAVRAVAATADGRYDRATELVDYPHIRPVPFVRAAALRIERADLVLPRLARVGYVRGAADQMPEALQSVGVPLVVLAPADLEKGDLSAFDVVVIGSRAYQSEPSLVASNGRLLDYVRQGGRLIVQYQQYPFVRGGYAPFPLTIANPHDRVTDETAPVTVLDPSSSLFTDPNTIGAADWDGWVQERGLYFAHGWDPAYRPLLEMGDNGEKLDGGLLVARLGRGLYVYTGLSFFRQLPAERAGGVSVVRQSAGAATVRCSVASGCRWACWRSWPRARPAAARRSSSIRPTAASCSRWSSGGSRRCTPRWTCGGSTWDRRRCWTGCAPSGRTPRPTSGSGVRRRCSRARRGTRCWSRPRPAARRTGRSIARPP